MPRTPGPDPEPSPPALDGTRLAAVSPRNLDEACFSVAAVRALRHARPEATLAVITPESIAPLWKTLPEVDDVHSYPDEASAREVAACIAEAAIETAVLWEDSAAAAALTRAGVRSRLGYDLKPLRKRLTGAVPLPAVTGPVEHRVRHYLGLLEALGIECYVPRNFAPPPLPPRPDVPRLALVPGSTFGSSSCWPVERFRDLGEALLNRGGCELVILAYPEQYEEADELEHLLDGRVQNFAGRFDLASLLDALSYCSALVANDGAVPHLAAHLGVPVVALFGPGDPVARRPLGRQHAVLSEHVECSPCRRDPCPLVHHRCLTELPVDRVLRAASDFLDAQAVAPAS